jgi:hypothetical protein
MMSRKNNKVYCTLGQVSPGVPPSPFRAKGAKNENGSDGGRLTPFNCNDSLWQKAPKPCPASNDGDWFRETLSNLWQRVSILITIETGWAL